MIVTNQITLRLNPSDLACLDALLKRTGIASASELMRLSLRKHAIAEGIEIEKLKPLDITREELGARAAKRAKKR